jgi:type II secretory pathway component PulC
MHRDRWMIWLWLLASCAGGAAQDPWDREMQVARRPALPRPGPESRAPRATAPPPQERVATLRPQAMSVVDLKRATLEAVLAAGPQRFMSGILLDPFFVDGQFVGFALTRFYDGDPHFAGVDLKRGDVVVRVNGQPIGRPEEFMRVWQDLRTLDEIRVEYLRGAQKRVLRIRVRD